MMHPEGQEGDAYSGLVGEDEALDHFAICGRAKFVPLDSRGSHSRPRTSLYLWRAGGVSRSRRTPARHHTTGWPLAAA